MEQFPVEETASAVALPSHAAAVAPESSEAVSSALDALSLERVREPLRAALVERGFDALTAVQAAVLDTDPARDLSITSQTGSGKTVALGLVCAAALLDDEGDDAGPRALVIVPTRELALQLADELRWLFAGARAVGVDCVTGGTSTHFERKRLARAPRMLVGTPGRLLDHLTSGALELGSVRELVLDEADQMLDMGFRDELEGILERTPRGRRTHLVSATFPPGIRQLAAGHQRQPLEVEGTRHGVANADIEHVAHVVTDATRYGALRNTLLLTQGERTLVFVKTRAETTELADRLAADGFSAQPLSGELAQVQRTRTLAAFRAGKVDVLVATDVAARGLDVPEVGLVVHAAPALDAEVYVHRSGRTGRAGRKGRSLLLVPARKERSVRRMLRFARVDVAWEAAPSAKSVNKELRRRETEALVGAIDGTEVTESQLDHARRLIAERDPAQVVAVLLEQARKDRIEPVEVVAPTQRAAREGDRFGDRARPAQGRRPGGQSDDFVSFSINWGTRSGATAKRVLAHVCRRGGITNREVGAIRLHEHRSTIDIQADAATAFEDRTRPRDKRDPHLFVERARPRAAARSARPGGAPWRAPRERALVGR